MSASTSALSSEWQDQTKTENTSTEDLAENAFSSGASVNSNVECEAGDSEISHPSKVLCSYQALSSRRVDLIGDYAGDELFLIEGDSMLMRCFDDDKLDFEYGCQILHAVYNVERFLHNLVRRRCNFNLIFFESNKLLCVPQTARQTNTSKYLLARAVILYHLQRDLAELQSNVAVHVFPSWTSPQFLDFLRRTSPYFVMAHDGALAVPQKHDHTEGSDNGTRPTTQQIQSRAMILSFISQGFNVALVNGLEWRDTKVMTMVLESRHKFGIRFSPTTYVTGSTDNHTLDISEALEKLGETKENLSQRQLLLILSLHCMLSSGAHSDQEQNLTRCCTAIVLHQAILAHMPLAARRLAKVTVSDDVQSLLQAFCSIAASILSDPSWQTNTSIGGPINDVTDFIDGRLFLLLTQSKPAVNLAVKNTLAKMLSALEKLGERANVLSAEVGVGPFDPVNQQPVSSKSLSVLPFDNAVFNEHLRPVQIRTDAATESEQSLAARKVSQEVTHWHNYKRPIISRATKAEVDAKKEFWAMKRNQLFMAEMRTYAASLTNAVGRSLEPETIIVGAPRKIQSSLEPTTDADATNQNGSASVKGKQVQKKAASGGSKTAAKNASKQAMLNNIALAKNKKEEGVNEKILGSWKTVCKGFEAEPDPPVRYRKAREYLINVQTSWRDVIGAEIELYLVNCLLHYWIEICRLRKQSDHVQVAALIWSHACSVAKLQNGKISTTIAQCLLLTVKALGLPPVPTFQEVSTVGKLAFTFALPMTLYSLDVAIPSKQFQLLECGPYLERSFDSKPDIRVEFNPDGWQRNVLDSIDKDQSVFVVAPTSAGKTFISFYAMRKVLEADDDGILVYVAPTKALVNQIAAEVQARYSKKFKYGGRSVWAIHTRDYRINNPTGCQVLVTVPHILQIMLLAPAHANSWSRRVRRIIFDEIHSIGQAEDGVIWEQLLLMAPCPIVALSATVGNPDEFSGWLSATQKAIGNELVTVQHPYRYSDLRKYCYLQPEHFSFNGIPEKSAFGSLGLEGVVGLNYVHPIACLVDKSRGIPEDLALEPRDCFFLWQAMVKVGKGPHKLPVRLAPEEALPLISRKVDILKWENSLKAVVKSWFEDASSPYDDLIVELEGNFRNEKQERYCTNPSQSNAEDRPILDDLTTSTLPLICKLHEQDALPAILFNYDRHECENICRAVVEELSDAELKQRKSGLKWERTLKQWEEWKAMKGKAASRSSKAANKKTKKSKADDAEDENNSKLDMQDDAAGADNTKWESFDPNAPATGYHLADHTKVQTSELEQYVRQLRYREIQPWLIDALNRGIGVHHAGMNRKYRQVVEILFRKRFLRVIIATGTLALGINMPCKTVVFSGDSVFLTALNYRQCAGRAGRRGFDLLGNVVFHGVSRQKVCRLMSSRLPDLNGHFPITTTLVLRLFSLLHESKTSRFAVDTINALLSQPRLYLGGPSFKEEVMHHLRFSIEYLRRQHLLGSDGAPLNFAGIVSHLYFTENSSFAFHALLKEGYFHELCSNIENSEKQTLETLMLVMAHLFNRRQCRQADVEHRAEEIKSSSSVVFLSPLPPTASKILAEHNRQTLNVYRAYVETFVDQHINHCDRTLPFSGIKVGTDTQELPASVERLSPSRVRSSFVALSGFGDDFDSIHDLCSSTREGVFLEEAVIPHLNMYPEETGVPLNAYLLDFFKHGDVQTLEKANRVRRADVWFLLNDFSLVLATIITSLVNFMKLSDGTDMDRLDIMGRMDAHEEEEDDKVAASEETQSEASDPSTADSAVYIAERSKPKPPKKIQAKNAESWEDVDVEEDWDGGSSSELPREEHVSAQELAAWDGKGGEGLKNVLKAFQKLQTEFNLKFRAMWA